MHNTHLTKQYELETTALVSNISDWLVFLVSKQHSNRLSSERTLKPSPTKKGKYNSEVNPAGILIIMETLQLLIQGLGERVGQLVEKKYTLL